MAEEPVAAERFAFGQAAAAAAAACRAARRPPLFSLTPCLPFWSSRPYSPPRNPQMLALLRLPRPPLARSSRVPPSPLRPPPARLAALPATVPGWVGPLSGGGGVRVLDLPLPPTGMLAALGLAIRRPSPPSPPFAPDRSLSPPFAARAVLHAFIQSRASGHGLCAPSPLMGIASVTSQITDVIVVHLVVVVCGSSTCPSPPLVCLPPLGWPSGAPRLPPRPLRPTAP